jgi:hypothetical protein
MFVIFLIQLLFNGFTEFFLLDSNSDVEIWRFFTAIFLHGGLAHLLYNIFALALFGSMLERFIGSRRFLVVFFDTIFQSMFAGISSLKQTAFAAKTAFKKTTALGANTVTALGGAHYVAGVSRQIQGAKQIASFGASKTIPTAEKLIKHGMSMTPATRALSRTASAGLNLTKNVKDIYSGKVMTPTGESLIIAFSRMISSAVREYPILSRVTAFDIGKIRKDSGHLLRDIRRMMIEKIVYYLKLIEIIMNPSQASPIFMMLLKEINSNDLKFIDSILSPFVEIELVGHKLDINSNEKEEADAIIKALDIMGHMKKHIVLISGSGSKNSHTRGLLMHIATLLEKRGMKTTLWDLYENSLPATEPMLFESLHRHGTHSLLHLKQKDFQMERVWLDCLVHLLSLAISH